MARVLTIILFCTIGYTISAQRSDDMYVRKFAMVMDGKTVHYMDTVTKEEFAKLGNAEVEELHTGKRFTPPFTKWMYNAGRNYYEGYFEEKGEQHDRLVEALNKAKPGDTFFLDDIKYFNTGDPIGKFAVKIR